MKPHKHAGLIKRWADGAEIEYRILQGFGSNEHWSEWLSTDNDSISWTESEGWEYRIKRLQWQQDLIDGAKAGKVVEVDSPSGWIMSRLNYVLDDYDFRKFSPSQFRFRPEEVPQWRKDLAQAIEDGKVVEVCDGGIWWSTAYEAEDFLNPNFGDSGSDYYRIKPEPKPDFYSLDFIYLCDDGDWVATDCEPANIKLTFDGETRKLKDAEVLK